MAWPVRVLVVEADEALASLFRSALDEDGFDTARARTTREASGLPGPWDVVLVSGLPASWAALDEQDEAQLRALAARAPVVLVADRPWLAGVVPTDLGVAAILPKPFVLGDLLDALRAVAGGAR